MGEVPTEFNSFFFKFERILYRYEIKAYFKKYLFLSYFFFNILTACISSIRCRIERNTFYFFLHVAFAFYFRFVPCDGTPYFNKDDRFTGNVNTRVDVPNIVHYVRFGHDARCFTQEQVDSILSVVENHQPSRIYIHTDNVSSVEELVDKMLPRPAKLIIDIHFYPQPKHAFGLNFSEPHRVGHAVDFTKLKLLR